MFIWLEYSVSQSFLRLEILKSTKESFFLALNLHFFPKFSIIIFKNAKEKYLNVYYIERQFVQMLTIT